MSGDVETYGPALAHAREVGDDVESLVVDAIPALEHEDNGRAHFDARLVESITTDDLPDWVRLDGVLGVDADTEVEIKACALEESNGASSTPGRYTFKGRDDGQHAYLVANDAAYLLVVYRDGDDGRELVAAVVIRATDLDRLLRQRWYDVDRSEGTMAQISWTYLLAIDRDDLGGVST